VDHRADVSLVEFFLELDENQDRLGRMKDEERITKNQKKWFNAYLVIPLLL
jgi:hypothetical protein